ncbi:hypothetical protein L484_011684 [Morus notabilis]|uniref:BZIP domain-containing protein n=1 Tax=Morus notabilis TaxID=981085 RepID=W9QT92_9ROSA|nr:hypothetical protein L484_011684 [Morus notabilis]
MEGFDKIMELDGEISFIPESTPLMELSQGVQINPNNHSIPVPRPQESDDSGQNKPVLDPKAEAKRLRRNQASREYSQRHRLKQLQYINDLEAEAESLRAELEITPSRIEYTLSKNNMLRSENIAMKQKLSVVSGELLFKDAQAEELMNERDRLALLFENNCLSFSENSPMAGSSKRSISYLNRPPQKSPT